MTQNQSQSQDPNQTPDPNETDEQRRAREEREERERQGDDVVTYNPADHTVEEVKTYIDKHPDEADAIIAAEQARGDDARVTLVGNTSQRRPDNGLRQITTERNTRAALPIKQTAAYQSREAKGWTPQSEASASFDAWWEQPGQ